jgi:hypothetical protein
MRAKDDASLDGSMTTSMPMDQGVFIYLNYEA